MPSASPSAQPTSQEQYAALYADWAPRYVACARRFGADASVLPDGRGVRNPIAAGRPESQGLDADCLREVGAPPAAAPLTAEFLRGFYDLLVEQAACLRQAGYVVAAPPSKPVWVENYSGESWNPLSEVNKAGRDVTEAEALCPQPDPVAAERRGRA